MADYEACWRTSWFRVGDVDAFKRALDSLEGEAEIDVQGDEVLLGGYGSMPVRWEEREEGSEVEVPLVDLVSGHLAQGCQAEIVEIGHEKLRYLVACKMIVGSEGIVETIDAGIG